MAVKPGAVPPAPAVVGAEVAGVGAEVAAPVVAGAVVSAPTVVGAVVGVVVAVVVLLLEPLSSEPLHAASGSARAPTSPRPLTERRATYRLRWADSCATRDSVSSTGAWHA